MTPEEKKQLKQAKSEWKQKHHIVTAMREPQLQYDQLMMKIQAAVKKETKLLNP